MLNNINFLSFKSNTNALSKINKKNNQTNVFKINGSNLKPLNKDTVSFTGVVEYKAALNNKDVCQKLHQDAKATNDCLKAILEQYFGGLVYDENLNPNGIIEPVQARVKSADSIEEKVSDKIRDALESKDDDIRDKIFAPRNEKAIKGRVRDISGTRIVVSEAFGEAMESVVDNLCRMIEDENLIIDQIENHTSPSDDAIPYFNSEQLQKIEESINLVREVNGLDSIIIEEKSSKTGYMALHLSIDTRQVPKLRKQQGFWSELQIIGSDVAMLKDIEDFCYKLKKGMAIKSEDISYKPFEQFFLDAYNDVEHYPDVKEAFKEYTIQAYKGQRNRRPSDEEADDSTNWAYKYPTIKECGLEGKIPPVLDFNILARIKRDCDDLYYVENNMREILDNLNTKAQSIQ